MEKNKQKKGGAPRHKQFLTFAIQPLKVQMIFKAKISANVLCSKVKCERFWFNHQPSWYLIFLSCIFTLLHHCSMIKC